jgi:hypothetical protein
MKLSISLLRIYENFASSYFSGKLFAQIFLQKKEKGILSFILREL